MDRYTCEALCEVKLASRGMCKRKFDGNGIKKRLVHESR